MVCLKVALKALCVGMLSAQHLALVFSFLCSHLTFLSVSDFVTILYEVFITNIDIRKCVAIKCAFRRSWSSHFFANFFSAVNKGRQPAKTAGYWPIFSRLLSSHFTVNFGKKLKMSKRSHKKNCATSASNVLVKVKLHFRSLKRVYLSHVRWKLIEGFWNACDIFTEQNPARNRLKTMKRSRNNNCKTSGSNV